MAITHVAGNPFVANETKAAETHITYTQPGAKDNKLLSGVKNNLSNPIAKKGTKDIETDKQDVENTSGYANYLKAMKEGSQSGNVNGNLAYKEGGSSSPTSGNLNAVLASAGGGSFGGGGGGGSSGGGGGAATV